MHKCDQRQRAMDSWLKKYHDKLKWSKRDREQCHLELDVIEARQKKSGFLHDKYVDALEGTW